MLLTIFITILALSMPTSAMSDSSEIEVCEIYREKAAELSCTNQNYLIQFGYRYCRTYVINEYRFLPETQQVLSALRGCLANDVKNDVALTCQTSEERAMASHLECYVQSGFCEVDAFDKVMIFSIAAKELNRKSFRKTMGEVASACVARD